MKKTVNLELLSRRYEADTSDMLAEHEEDAEPQELRILTEATLDEQPGRVELSYDEDESTGIDGSTHLIFDPDEPDIFTMQRSGIASTTMVFIPGMRHACKYRTPVAPFDLVLTTHSLKNRLLDEGWLELDYTTELARVSHARTFLRIVISPQQGEEDEQ